MLSMLHSQWFILVQLVLVGGQLLYHFVFKSDTDDYSQKSWDYAVHFKGE